MGNEDDIQKIIDYSGRDFRYIGTRPVRPDGGPPSWRARYFCAAASWSSRHCLMRLRTLLVPSDSSPKFAT